MLDVDDTYEVAVIGTPKGKHGCTVVLKSGRVCGLKHPASKCQAKNKL